MLAKVGMSHVQKPNEDIKWCEQCGRYYNPKVGHECVDNAVRENQFKLEKFLGRYKIVKEGN